MRKRQFASMEVLLISLHWKTSSMLHCLNSAKLANRLLLRGYSTGLRPGSAWTMEILDLTLHTTLGITLTLIIVNKPFWSQLCQQKASLYLPAGGCYSSRAASVHLHFNQDDITYSNSYTADLCNYMDCSNSLLPSCVQGSHSKTLWSV